jgi:hypothetical protein
VSGLVYKLRSRKPSSLESAGVETGESPSPYPQAIGFNVKSGAARNADGDVSRGARLRGG